MPADNFKLELLCVHHDLESFSSGNPEFDDIARRLQRRIAERDTDGFVAVVAVTADGRVAGLASTADVDIALTDEALDTGQVAAESPAKGVWLFYQLLVIAQEFQHGKALDVLLEELTRIGEAKLRNHPHYVGEVASPVLSRPEHHVGLESYLRERGFRELVDDPMRWWYRPRDRGDRDDLGELAS